MTIQISKNIKAIILGIIFTFGVGYVFASWSGPSCPPPGCGVDTPINSTSASQARTNSLSVGSASAPQSGYIFSASGGTNSDLKNSFFDGVITNRLVYEDGSSNKTDKVLVSDNNGVGRWRSIERSVDPGSFTVNSFRLVVPYYAKVNGQVVSKIAAPYKGVSAVIPASYQYCAISQVGPDFGKSVNDATICGVERESNGTWLLFGTRGKDPEFICQATCFSSNDIGLTISE